MAIIVTHATISPGETTSEVLHVSSANYTLYVDTLGGAVVFTVEGKVNGEWVTLQGFVTAPTIVVPPSTYSPQVLAPDLRVRVSFGTVSSKVTIKLCEEQ